VQLVAAAVPELVRVKVLLEDVVPTLTESKVSIRGVQAKVGEVDEVADFPVVEARFRLLLLKNLGGAQAMATELRSMRWINAF